MLIFLEIMSCYILQFCFSSVFILFNDVKNNTIQKYKFRKWDFVAWTSPVGLSEEVHVFSLPASPSLLDVRPLCRSAFPELPSDWEVRQDKRLLVFLTIAHNNVIKEMRKYDILVKTPQVSGRFFRMGFHLAGSSILRNLIIGNYVRILLLAPSNEKSSWHLHFSRYMHYDFL